MRRTVACRVMGEWPIINKDGSYLIMLRPCATAVLAELLDPSVPFVWLPNHSPMRHIEWWDVDLPIAHDRPPRRVRARWLRFDLLLKTAEFKDVADHFDGITAFHMTRPVPNSLIIEQLPEEQLYRVLRQNGLLAHLHQPHSMEVAMYRTWDKEWMDNLLERETIRNLLQPSPQP